MGNWIGTNSGKKIDLDNPQADQVCLADIADGLSKLCRFNGQIKTFYSVAEHCLKVAALVPEKYKLQAILHDASEAYICDIPTPLKRQLGPAYYDVEHRVQKAIGLHFGVDLINLPDVVKQADRVMLCTEHDVLQDKSLDWGPDYEGVLRYPGFFATGAEPDRMAQLYRDRVTALLQAYHTNA